MKLRDMSKPMSGIKVVKFGGSSLSDANQFKKVTSIITSDKDRRYVVRSAPGKRFKEDTKVTDLLYQCDDLAAAKKDFSEPFTTIKERFNGIIADLGVNLSLEKEYEKLQKSLSSNPEKDYTASRGEYLNGMILASYLGYDFIDSATVVFFKEDGSFDSEKTNTIMSIVLSKHHNAVVPGFYGSAYDGKVKTFSRGGSDVTGSIVARATDAEVYENWTDVSGFLKADPRIVNNPSTIQVITYGELRELSYMGATVLHEDAVFPVRDARIPINIRNTNAPEDDGTLIVPREMLTDESDDDMEDITGVSGKKGFSVISMEKAMMNNEIGFCWKVLGVLAKYNVSMEHMPSGIDMLDVVVDSASLNAHREEIINEICEEVHPDFISIEDDLALIAIVGRGMVGNIGIAGRILSAISKSNINIRLIDQGTQEDNIIISVEEEYFEKAVQVIYNEFSK